jgi:hypothetical protein
VPRYEKGEFVVVRDVIFSRREKQVGRVISVKPSKWATSSLDKYVVTFPDGEQEEFWDVQLERSRPAS